jgi:hypothetical protein
MNREFLGEVDPGRVPARERDKQHLFRSVRSTVAGRAPHAPVGRTPADRTLAPRAGVTAAAIELGAGGGRGRERTHGAAAIGPLPGPQRLRLLRASACAARRNLGLLTVRSIVPRPIRRSTFPVAAWPSRQAALRPIEPPRAASAMPRQQPPSRALLGSAAETFETQGARSPGESSISHNSYVSVSNEFKREREPRLSRRAATRRGRRRSIEVCRRSSGSRSSASQASCRAS